MPQLSSLICPNCHKLIAGRSFVDKVSVVNGFDDCLRRCDPCGIGASNAADPRAATYIYRDPLKNIPIESRKGASEALGQALNVRSRESKRRRFGFSTSEDAVTWVVFTYLYRTGQLLPTLRRIGLIAEDARPKVTTLLLWGAPIDGGARGEEIRTQLHNLCVSLQEDPNSFSEPDVIIDLGEKRLIFIEVKYRSGNDFKPPDYPGWSKYTSVAGLTWQIEDVKSSGCYELARNWCLLKCLAAHRPATLVNLGPAKLFVGAEGARLHRLVTALNTDEQSQFGKVRWSDFLDGNLGDLPDWFAHFCRSRGLIE
jgi:hypothetical protein